MKKEFTKKVGRGLSLLLVFSMIVAVFVPLTGCGKEEVVEEDTQMVINVTKEELAPEITDEDRGITRKEISELSKIVGYQSWEGYNFLVLRNEGGEGSIDTTIQVEDEELFNALYNGRLRIYVDASYESVSQDDEMYAAYAKGLRSLGNKNFTELSSGTKVEVVEEEPTEQHTEAVVESPVDTAEEPIEGQTEEMVEEPAEEPTETVEEGSEEARVEEAIEEPVDSETVGYDVINAEAKAAEEQLKKDIEEYMQKISLKRATQILVFALDGQMLGAMTPAKLNDYVAECNVNFPNEKYNTTNGNVYVSDLENGVKYDVSGIKKGDALEYTYTIKNDIRKPIVIKANSETSNKEEFIFEKYMETSKSTGWYLVENEFTFTGTEESYGLTIDIKNSDTDLAKCLPEGRVLYINELSKDVVEVHSNYMAIVNNTDQEVYIEADTGDYHVLGSKQAVGVHRSAYSTLKYYFEGANAITE